jgi:RNA polymerase sigma factor (sigma-70 family)
MIATVRDDPTVVDLVERARDGDQGAWDGIVERYAALVWAVCRRHGLSGPDAEEVASCVWLRLVERLDGIREPAALPGWLATTTRRECLYYLRTKNRLVPVEDDERIVQGDDPAADEWLLRQERHIALRAGFAELSDKCRWLLSMLFREPPASYSEISAELGMAVGAIGPSRQRCLDKLRTSRALAALLDPPAAGAAGAAGAGGAAGMDKR